MQTLLAKLDDLAGVRGDTGAVVWLERVAFIFLVLMIVSAPHSIAATQTAWLTGMFLWVARLFLKPRPHLEFGLLDIALWALFGWSVITSVLSYTPEISIDKLRNPAVFLIFYFVFYNLRNRRAVILLAFLLIGSCMVNVLWVPIERLIGRGVEIHGVGPDSPLSKALLIDGDALLTAYGKKLRTPEDVAAAIESSESTKITFYRPDFEFAVEVKRADLLPGTDAMSRLGIGSWKKSRNWRSRGFYGHYATYAEVLQLIGSLVLGLFVSTVSARARDRGATLHRFKAPLVLSFCLAAISLALLLTVTRAPQLALLISGLVIVLVGFGKKWLLATVVLALPIALIGVMFLQQSRHVGFFDQNDESIKYRQTVWQEGIELWTASPRHLIFGVGMDSLKRHAAEWQLFDSGRLPIGHFHSTPINLLVERGLPALLLWLAVLVIYARRLLRGLKAETEPYVRGVLLGCLGGAVGFFVSGLVHFNLGDQEVAMVFFVLMGLSSAILRLERKRETH